MNTFVRHIILYTTTALFLLHGLTPHQHQNQEKQESTVCAINNETSSSLFSYWMHHIDEHHAQGQLELVNPTDLSWDQSTAMLPPSAQDLFFSGPCKIMAAPPYPEAVYSTPWLSVESRGPPART